MKSLLVLLLCWNLQAQFISGEIIDLTHSFSDESVYWVTAKKFQLDTVAFERTEQGYFYSAFNFETAEHGGTHIDAPLHFAENGFAVDQIPLKSLIGEGVRIDVSSKVMANRDYQISIEDLKEWELKNGEIPEASIVLFHTGFGSFYPDPEKYLGTSNRGITAVKELHFPGLSAQAAVWLITKRKIKAVGIDTASIDFGQSGDFQTHVELMTRNIPAFENVANLDLLPLKDFVIIALPMKIKGGSGSPLRIIAVK